MKTQIRWIALGVGVVLVAFSVVLAKTIGNRAEASLPRIVQQHRTVPWFTVTTLDGKPLDSSALRGKTYVVNFFNSWCIPCQQEAPALKQFYAEHKNDPDFAMLGVVRDDDAGAVRGYVRNEKFDWPIAMDPKGSAALGFGTTGQPETYIVRSDGVAACGTLGISTTAALDDWLEAVRAGEVCQ
jgi:cytochrome c biogenesis protein CcmG, thiol:disulfide interchange protein DsbE